MGKNVEHVSHIKSKLKTNGLPQLPSPDKLVDGEIAINYAEGVETISIKNESGSIVTFSSDNYYTEKKLGSGFTNNDATVTEAIDDLEYMVVNKEEAIAAALNDLNGRKLDASAYTPTDLSNYYTKGETSGKTEISNALDGKVNTATYTGHTADTSLHFSGNEKRNLDALATNIESISGITSNDIANWNAAAGGVDMSKYYKKTETSGATELQTAFNGKTDTATTTALNNVVATHTANTNIHLTTTEKGQLHTHTNKTYLDGITGTVGTMAYENASSYSSATQVSTALSNKVDKTEYAAFSATTNTSIEDLSGKSETFAAALNDLNAKKLDTTAYTPVDTSLYYKKTETDSKIAEAVSGKVNTSDFNTYSGNVDTAIGSKAAQSDLNTLSGTVTRHTANTSIHVTSTEKENLDSLATNIAAISGVTSTKISNWDGAVTNLGGFKLVEITQSDYDNLPTPRDSKTLYIIRN